MGHGRAAAVQGLTEQMHVYWDWFHTVCRYMPWQRTINVLLCEGNCTRKACNLVHGSCRWVQHYVPVLLLMAHGNGW